MAKKQRCPRPVNRLLMMRTRGLLGPFFQNTGISCVKTVGNSPLSGGLPMLFEANVPDPSTGEMLGVAKGVGGLTEGASTSIWMPDYLGVYVEVPANTPAWEGARWDGGVAYAEPGYPIPRLVYAPEKTNLEDHARDLTSNPKYGGLTASFGSSGIDQTPSATTLTDNDAAQAGYIRIQTTVVPGAKFYTTLFYIEKKTDAVYFQITQQFRGGTVVSAKTLAVRYSDLNTIENSAFIFDDYAVELIGDFIRVAVVQEDVGGDNNEVRSQISPFYSIDGTNTDVTLTGSAVVDGFEVVESSQLISAEAQLKNPPVFTAGAPVTRTARALSFDGANHDPDQSGYYFEWEPSMLVVGGALHGVIGFNSGIPGDGFYHPQTASRLRLSQWYSPKDSENLNDGKDGGETHYSAFVIDTDVADSLQAYDNDGAVWTTPLSSVGSIAVPGIYLGVSSPYVIKYGPIRRYQAPLDEMKAQLESDIAAGEAA